MSKIKIVITGEMASGKTVMRRRIEALLEEELGHGRITKVTHWNGHKDVDELEIEFLEGDFKKLADRSK